MDRKNILYFVVSLYIFGDANQKKTRIINNLLLK